VSADDSNALRKCIDHLVARLQRYRGRTLGEQNTKASLIEPLLESLGWDTRDFEEVHREFKAKRADRPVDYALQLLLKPLVFIEAKGLGENLSDRKWIAQILGYATVAGVTWCVLTDGDEYRFYNASAPVDADEKLFCTIRLSDGQHDRLYDVLGLISRSNVEAGTLRAYWNTHFVDRQVHAAVGRLISEPDRALVRMLKRHLGDINPRQIVDSLKRLRVTVQSQPIASSGTGAASAEVATPIAKGKHKGVSAKKKRTSIDVTLEQIVAAGVLSAPLELFRKYKGKIMQATLHMDGSVEFGGQRFSSPSKAAEYARSTITGRPMNTNGWSFWQYLDADKKRRELVYARTQYMNGARSR
jgi:predicted type IV restriction endonuclease